MQFFGLQSTRVHLCSCKSFAKIVPIPKNYIQFPRMKFAISGHCDSCDRATCDLQLYHIQYRRRMNVSQLRLEASRRQAARQRRQPLEAAIAFIQPSRQRGFFNGEETDQKLRLALIARKFCGGKESKKKKKQPPFETGFRGILLTSRYDFTIQTNKDIFLESFWG